MNDNPPFMRITAPNGDVYYACTSCVARMASAAVRGEDGHLHFEANLHDFAWNTREDFEAHAAKGHPVQ